MTPAAEDRPKHVRWAILLMYAVLALGAVRLMIAPVNVPQNLPASWLWVTLAIVFAVFLWIIVMTGRRHSWARWVYVILFVLGLPAGLRMTRAALDAGGANGAIAALQLAMQLIIIVLLFSPPSNAWFRTQSPA